MMTLMCRVGPNPEAAPRVAAGRGGTGTRRAERHTSAPTAAPKPSNQAFSRAVCGMAIAVAARVLTVLFYINGASSEPHKSTGDRGCCCQPMSG